MEERGGSPGKRVEREYFLPHESDEGASVYPGALKRGREKELFKGKKHGGKRKNAPYEQEE